ncbi:MAG: hypothetical protein H0T79_24480, partial [Deltaproteobacteria bacterium]|nr:hypothetical protein [Deltaproteobacteria bacterium]
MSVVEANGQGDYFANHARARQFPWTLYHQPLEKDLGKFLGHVEPGEVLVIGCGLLQEIDVAPDNLTYFVVDIDGRAVDAVRERNDPRIVGGCVVPPETPLDQVLGDVLGDDHRFAAIYAKEVVEHVLAWPAWLVGLRRSLI